MTFPSGDLTIDPNGACQSFGDELIKSVAQPYLYGSRFVPTTTFTRRYGRWLPTSVADLSPDSSHYAYWEFKRDSQGGITGSRVHVVDVTSGLDRVVYSQGMFVVLDYGSEGVYLAATGPTGEAQSGLWLLDPRSGSLQAIAPQAGGSPFGFYLIGAGAAWYGDVAPGDQPPNQGIGPMDRVLRFDLKSHAVTPWFRRPGMQVQAIGFDGQDRLIVMATTELAGIAVQQGSGSLELWLVTAAGIAQQLYSTSKSSDFVGSFNAPLADDHGVWFGTAAGVFLYTSDGKFVKVSEAAGEVAGRCS